MQTIKNVMDMNIEDMEFPVRCNNCMKNLGIKTLSQLTKHSKTQIEKSRNMGKKSIEIIDQKLASMGLFYEMDERAWLAWGLRHIELIKSL